MKTPALVMVGEQDEATPPPMSVELAAGLLDARLRIIPGCRMSRNCRRQKSSWS